jgi:hypothetical protein
LTELRIALRPDDTEIRRSRRTIDIARAQTDNMADTVTLRTRKFMRNALLARKQMVV